MMMNSSNAVYAGGVCPQQPPVVEYGGEPQLFYGDVGQQHYGYTEPQTAEPPNSHLPHQIINEPNGLSYTNLDAGHAAATAYNPHRNHNHHHQPYYPQASGHFYRTFEYDSSPDVPTYHHPSYHNLEAAGLGRRSSNPYATGTSAYEGYENQQASADCHAMAAFRTQTPQQQHHPTYKWMQVKRSLPKPGKFASVINGFPSFADDGEESKEYIKKK